jgi:putative membrane protein
MTHSHASIWVGLAAVAGVAQAADTKALPAYTNPGFANPDTPGLMDAKPKADVTNLTDIIFLKSLAKGGQAEVDLGKLTAQHSSTRGVTEFAQRMINDHGNANGKLASVAHSANVELPGKLDAEHEALRVELARLKGDAYDLRYVDSQIVDHQKAVELLIYEVAQGQHQAVREFAASTLPVVEEHLVMARSLREQLVGEAGRKPVGGR